MRSRILLLTIALLFAAVPGCWGEGEGKPVRVRVRPGAPFSEVADSLSAKGIIEFEPVFRLYARLTRSENAVKAGTYAFQPGTPWDEILEAMREGRVLTAKLIVPEGWNLRGIAARMAAISTLSADSILEQLVDTAVVGRFGVPGPTLEGYLYPATYTFPLDLPVDSMARRMVRRYRQAWTPRMRALADSIGMSEREVVTLASIVEKEAKRREEMPLIAAVYRNRLRIGMPLQADPTVQYALGSHQSRLLYEHIDEVAENPYNTYRIRGLPPGPIASPSAMAMQAVLIPADVEYLYFVARPDGSHVFTRSLAEHNRAKATIRGAIRAAAGDAAGR